MKIETFNLTCSGILLEHITLHNTQLEVKVHGRNGKQYHVPFPLAPVLFHFLNDSRNELKAVFV